MTKHEAAVWDRGYVRAKVCSSFGMHCGHCGHLDVSWPFHQRGKQPFGPCLCDGFECGEGENGFWKDQMFVSSLPHWLVSEP